MATAGAMGGTPGSPTPVGGAAERIGTEIDGAYDVSGDGAEDLWLSVERTLPLPDLQRLSSPRDSTRFGAGCRAASPAPLLEVSSLRLGSTAQIVGTHAPANAAGCALMSLRPSSSLALDAHGKSLSSRLLDMEM